VTAAVASSSAPAPAPARQQQQQQRLQPFSTRPEASVYGGPASPVKPVTLRTLRGKYEKGVPITMVTAYDYPSGVHVRSVRPRPFFFCAAASPLLTAVS